MERMIGMKGDDRERSVSYPDHELDALRRDLESDLVERKESAADGKKIRCTICAFANDLPGTGKPGVVFVGVRDDGADAGLPITDELLKQLANIHGEGSILPLPTMTVQRRVVHGVQVAVVTVAPSASPPVRYQGRAWVRVGPTVREASAEDERVLTERRRSGDLPFDMRPAERASVEDLDRGWFRDSYLPDAISREPLRANDRSTDLQLRSLRLVREGRPPWGTLLALGRDRQAWLPGSYAPFVRFAGAELTDPVQDRKQVTGTLADVLRQLDDLIDLNIQNRADVAGHRIEAGKPDYPADALRQLARNAVMHRAYDGTNAPIRMYWYVDRVEITSPGGLYGRITPENFGQGDTDYRNPLIAEVMHHLGFAQRFGLGLPLARRALVENGNPKPDFQLERSLVGVTVRPRQ